MSPPPPSAAPPDWGERTAELLPLRMVNEHTYCPRLFWLMHVENVFEENAHTVQGSAEHARADIPGGRITAPEGSDQPHWESRSLWLSCAELGVAGRLDWVDEGEGEVMPVDKKKGRPAPDESLWPSDEVQLVLQGLLLRRHGYAVRRVAAYYGATRRRVVVELTPERAARATAAVTAARLTASGATIPAPLEDSPKCPGCSLNVVCLPDEVNALAAERLAREQESTDGARLPPDVPIRRVVPASVDALPLYVTEPGMRVGIAKGTLVLKPRAGHTPAEEQRVGLHRVGQLCVFGTAQVSTQAVQACLRAGTPIYWFSGSGWYYGRASGQERRQVRARIAQHRAVGAECGLAIARRLIADKIANCRTLLRRNDPDRTDRLLARLRHLAQSSLAAPSPDVLLGYEGEAARLYWGAYSALIARTDVGFAMNGRTRRPPGDRTNAMLGYVYAVLLKECVHAVESAGLDPYLGVLHTAHHGAPALALDLMEPFRSLLGDSVVLGVVRRGELRVDDFIEAGEEVRVRPHARRTLIAAFERRLQETVTHPVFGYVITYRQVLNVQSRLLARTFGGEVDSLPAFRTR